MTDSGGKVYAEIEKFGRRLVGRAVKEILGGPERGFERFWCGYLLSAATDRVGGRSLRRGFSALGPENLGLASQASAFRRVATMKSTTSKRIRRVVIQPQT